MKLKKIFIYPEVGVVVGIIIVWAFFYILSPKFLQLSNIGNILTESADMGIIAFGMAFLMISGEFDISVGSVYVIVPTVMIRFSQAFSLPLFIGFLIGLGLACIIGFFNSIITLKFKLPSFIVTLATMMLLSGLLLAITGGFITEYSGRPLLFSILAKRISYFRLSTIWMIGMAVFFSTILNHTKYGNSVYATGGNMLIAKKMGINVKRVKTINFILCSFLAGFAGCVSVARVYSVNPTTGFGLMFNAMASAIIGGCLITGGFGSILGTFLGVLLLSSLNSGLILAGASPYWYRGFVGAIILLVVITNKIVTGRAKNE